MKKIIIAFGILVISLFLGIFLLSSHEAIADDTCADNCEKKNGHCSWQSGGTVYICPSWFDDKEHHFE